MLNRFTSLRFLSIGLRSLTPSQPRRESPNISSILSETELITLLEEPSWSVKSLLGICDEIKPSPAITQTRLHHLLRLSALPLLRSADEEIKTTKTLVSQLGFVQAIQKVDTAGVQPLQSIRDETTQAKMESEINLHSLEEEFHKEEIVGTSRRIRRRKTIPVENSGVKNWDALVHVSEKTGRYIRVETGKS